MTVVFALEAKRFPKGTPAEPMLCPPTIFDAKYEYVPSTIKFWTKFVFPVVTTSPKYVVADISTRSKDFIQA